MFTQKQLEFIESLFEQKGVATEVRDQVYQTINRPEVRPNPHVRQIIDGLLSLPDVAKNAGPPKDTSTLAAGLKHYPKTDEVLRSLGIPVAFYALSPSELPSATADVNLHGYLHGQSYLFVQIREFKDVRYVRLLRGAPGRYTRHRLDNRAEEHALAHAIAAAGTLELTQRFGELYSRCGKCGAELTDDESRRLKLGPHCRKEFGL
jgi:Family of unknown function (DUF6011)